MQEVGRIGVCGGDTGSYQDWGSRLVGASNQNNCSSHYHSNASAQFVSVISVDNSEPSVQLEKPYVTVVSVEGDNEVTEEEVLVYRLPGERLGFGLKFDGGLRIVDKVAHLYIQSCAGDSPASRTQASWGPLGPGDEIVSIDGVRVDTMTRTDCVRALKESAVVIKLVVKRKSDPSIPPPIPPRKCLRRKQSDSQICQSSQPIEPITKPRAVVLAQAEVYTDLFSSENTLPAESESDDTGSSLSTVVSRVSSTANSSFSDGRSINSVDISPPATVKASTPFDLDKVLEPFLQLERELSSSTLDSGNLFTRLVEASNFLDTNAAATPSVGPDLPPRPVPRLSTVNGSELSGASLSSNSSLSVNDNKPCPPRSDITRPPCPPRPQHLITHSDQSPSHPPRPQHLITHTNQSPSHPPKAQNLISHTNQSPSHPTRAQHLITHANQSPSHPPRSQHLITHTNQSPSHPPRSQHLITHTNQSPSHPPKAQHLITHTNQSPSHPPRSQHLITHTDQSPSHPPRSQHLITHTNQSPSHPPIPPPPPLPPPPPPPPPTTLSTHKRLPRLIDFVPKDRSDLLAPSPIHHPPDKNVREEGTKLNEENDYFSKPKQESSCNETTDAYIKLQHEKEEEEEEDTIVGRDGRWVAGQMRTARFRIGRIRTGKLRIGRLRISNIPHN